MPPIIDHPGDMIDGRRQRLGMFAFPSSHARRFPAYLHAEGRINSRVFHSMPRAEIRRVTRVVDWGLSLLFCPRRGSVYVLPALCFTKGKS